MDTHTELKWLRPREIARRGLIRNSTGGDNVNSNYFYILKLIKNGRLKAKNYGVGTRDYFLVHTDEITRYNSAISA